MSELRDRIAKAIQESPYNVHYSGIGPNGAGHFADAVIRELGLTQQHIYAEDNTRLVIHRWVTRWVQP